MVIWVINIFFLYCSSVYSCHLLISYASIRSLLFLSFNVPTFAWKVPLVSLVFLKRSIVFPIQLFSLVSWQWYLRKAFLSLPALLWNSPFKMGVSLHLSFTFCFSSFQSYGKASPESHFAFLRFFFLRFLLPFSCTMSQTSVHTSWGTMSIRCSPLNLFLTFTE